MAKKTTKAKGKTKGVKIDFGDTESRGGKKRSGGRKHYPEGDYPAKVTAVRLGHSPEKETPGVYVTFKFTKKLKGKSIEEPVWLTPKNAWRVRTLLEACGLKVPNKKATVDFDKLVGKNLAVTLEDDEYDGKVSSRVNDFFLLSELNEKSKASELDTDEDDEDEDDEEEDDEDEDEDEEDDEDEDDDEDDEDEDDLDEIEI